MVTETSVKAYFVIARRHGEWVMADVEATSFQGAWSEAAKLGEPDMIMDRDAVATNPVDPLQAISFALSLGDDHDAMSFLQDWNEGVYWADYLNVINSNRRS